MDEVGRQVQLENRIGASIYTQRQLPAREGDQAMLGFGLNRYNYPDQHASDRLLLEGDWEYWQSLPGDRRQLRYRVEAAHALDPGERVFSRLRAGMAWRTGTAPRQLLQARVRVGYRDQDEANTFAGYDQYELLGELNYSWQSRDWRWYLLGTLYVEERFADNDIYSYTQRGARLLTRYRLNESTRAFWRLSGFGRDYRSGGRDDTRLRSTLGVEHWLSERTRVEVYAGFESNRSNQRNKDYDGNVFGLSLHYTWPWCKSCQQ
ncbi:hypothetical protein [Pseudomonas abyssi]|uniref:hypothetical protein n=1 Tax=Pseudomonas abyssi TaxID=170540 RepID=UPI003C7E5143